MNDARCERRVCKSTLFVGARTRLEVGWGIFGHFGLGGFMQGDWGVKLHILAAELIVVFYKVSGGVGTVSSKFPACGRTRKDGGEQGSVWLKL